MDNKWLTRGSFSPYTDAPHAIVALRCHWADVEGHMLQPQEPNSTNPAHSLRRERAFPIAAMASELNAPSRVMHSHVLCNCNLRMLLFLLLLLPRLLQQPPRLISLHLHLLREILPPILISSKIPVHHP